MKICHKELREARRWLRSVLHAALIEKPRLLTSLVAESDELVRIFSASIRTAQKKLDAKPSLER